VEGVHFLEGTDPARVAQKLLRVNLSDLAAMGAEPRGYWIGVQIQKEGAKAWLESFVLGLKADQEEFRISLMGGDTVATPGPIALSITAIGMVPKGSALLRSGAKPGDRLYVSGTIGDGALGLKVARGGLPGLSEAARDFLIDRLECPSPRLAIGQSLRGVASAAIDISDGLVADAGHMANASGVGLQIDAGQVPLSAAAQDALGKGSATIADLIAGGDDFELLFALPEGTDLPGGAETELTQIGFVEVGQGVAVTFEGRPVSLPKRGYTHL